jgi:tRNA-splicing ligase RtcB
MVHSGSRNVGKKVCDHFDEIAINLNRAWYSNSSIPFLPINSLEGRDYLEWMNLCVKFSFLNREIMIRDIIKDLRHYFSNLEIITKSIEGVDSDIISISHNYASLENHMGKNYWVHRKGAVLARKGIIGIIPGSQSTNSFITLGLGDEKSLTSCSHGSGRKMGRKEFNVQNQSRVAEIENDMKNKGIVFSKFGKSERGRDKGLYDLSEAGDAYKDVLSVMEQQKDLVKPLVKLSPLISWKG